MNENEKFAVHAKQRRFASEEKAGKENPLKLRNKKLNIFYTQIEGRIGRTSMPVVISSVRIKAEHTKIMNKGRGTLSPQNPIIYHKTAYHFAM